MATIQYKGNNKWILYEKRGFERMAKKIPQFKTEEEARFWDEHDSTEFIEEFEPVDIKVAPELEERIINRRELKKPITLRLEPKQIDTVKRIAIMKGLPYQTLIRMWITERIKAEKF